MARRGCILAIIFALLWLRCGAVKKLGPAPALSAGDWDHWTTFILNNHTSRMYVLIMLTGMFALRCQEACMLNAEDIQLDNDPPQLVVKSEPGRAKSPGIVPIMPEQAELLKLWMRHGVTKIDRKRLINMGTPKIWRTSSWSPPVAGYF
jgi:integrase